MTAVTEDVPERDVVGRVEVRGIDRIPERERHGRPRDLFPLWLAANTSYVYLLFGGTLMVLGLTIWQALAVALAGNLIWLVSGVVATSGPAAGAPSTIIERALYGVRGNRVAGAGLLWFGAVGYEAINLSVGAVAGFAVASELGIAVTTPVKVAILVLVAVATFAVSVLGHATIMRASQLFTLLLGAAVLVLAVFVIDHADLGYRPHASLGGGATAAAMLIGFTIVASGPLSWANAADFTRYLPTATSRRAIAGWVALGGFIPTFGLAALGILAGTAIDMTDPQTSMREILPQAFYVLFLLIVVGGSITNNVLTAYSSGLALQAAGVRTRRSRSVLIDAAIAGAMTTYALFVSDFLKSLNEFLQLAVTWWGPAMAIFFCDLVLRRGRYDADGLQREDAGSPYWGWHGVNVAGVGALVAGTAAALMCANTTIWQGPVSRALDGADLSVPAGMLVAAAVYATAARRRQTIEHE